MILAPRASFRRTSGRNTKPSAWHVAPGIRLSRGNFGQSPVEDEVVPFGRFAHLAALAVFPAFGGGNRNVGHHVPAGERARLLFSSIDSAGDSDTYRPPAFYGVP